jgi:hypothetical protein
MERELKKLKKYLPKGYALKLAEEFSVTPMTVSYALGGRHHRFDIIKRAIEMAQENINIKKKLKQTIEEIEL